MTAPDPHESYDELAVGHALRSLEPGDEHVFLAHLAACARCERAVAEHGDTLAHLAYAADPASPPAGLWDAVRAGVEASDRASSWPDQAPAVGVTDLSAVRRDRAASRRLASRFAAATSVAAGFALVLALVAQNASLREQKKDEIAYSKGVARVVALYGSDVKLVPLRSAGVDQPAAVAVVDGDRLHLVLDELAVNDPKTSTYVLWENNTRGEVRAVGTFDVTGEHGVEVVENLVLGDVQDLSSFVVTRESGRTAPAKSMQPAVATGTFA